MVVMCREGDLNQLRSEIHEVLGNRNVNDEKFQAVVLEEIASLKTQMVQVGAGGKGRRCQYRVVLVRRVAAAGALAGQVGASV